MSFSLVLHMGATVISLIFTALSITFAVLINSNTQSMNSFVADITRSFNNSPIFDFNVSKNGPSTFEEEELVLHKWPGIANGCDCRGIRASNINCKNKICRGFCGRNETRAGCKHIYGAESENLTTWKKMRFIKRKNEGTYLDYLKDSVPKGSNCSEGFKQCGILDSLGQILCMKEQMPCPLNYLEFSGLPNSTKEFNVKTVQLGDSSYVHYSNESINTELIINFQVSDEDDVCIRPAEYNSKMKKYVLDNYEYTCKKYRGKYYDNRYKKLDTMKKKEFFSENDIAQIFKRLPDYPLSSLDQIDTRLFKRTYIGINKNCFEETNLLISKIPSILSFSSSFYNAFLVLSIMGAMLSFATLLQFFIYRKSGDTCICTGFLIFFMVFIVGNIVTSLVYIIKAKHLKYTQECGDETTNSLIGLVVNATNKAKYFGIFFIVGSLLQALTIYFKSEIIVKSCCGIPAPLLSSNEGFKALQGESSENYNATPQILCDPVQKSEFTSDSSPKPSIELNS